MNPDAAHDMIAGIADACALLRQQPFLGGELCRKMQSDLAGRFLIWNKYIIIYDVDEVVSVLRVLDTRTDYLRVLLDELSTK